MKKTLLTALCVGAAFCMSAQTVVFEDDFEWLKPWSDYVNSDGVKVGDAIGTNDHEAYACFLTTPKVDEVSALDALKEKGYNVFCVQNGKDDSEAAFSGYLQTNYLKFGKSGHQGGLTLPSMAVPEGATATLSFDWTKQRQGSGTYDPTKLIVIVDNGEATPAVFEVAPLEIEKGAVMSWSNTSVELKGANITANTKISIRPEDAQWRVSGQHRWFIDNIKVTASETGAVEGVIVDAVAPAEYYNLQGVRVANPENGLYIVRQGKNVRKILVK